MCMITHVVQEMLACEAKDAYNCIGLTSFGGHTSRDLYIISTPISPRDVINNLIDQLRSVVPPSEGSPTTHYARGPNNSDRRPKVLTEEVRLCLPI